MTQRPSLNLDQQEAVAALGLYHLMTVEQLQRVGVADGSRRRIEDALRLLIRKHLVDRKDAETIAYKDRVPAVHWLIPKGAAEIGATGSERRFKGVSQTRHRLAIVDVHIALQDWAFTAGAKVVRFVADFERVGQHERRPTTIEYGAHTYIPDAIARVRLPNGDPAVIALEVERGGSIEDRSPFRKGLSHWRGVAEDAVVENVLGLDHPALFLVVFQSADMCRKALGDWVEPGAAVWQRFFCKGLDELGPKFDAGWWQPNGRQAAIFSEARG